ncbi:hypothetical protein P8452_26014 [Trifolium repens]|nr:hypothetical protein P8452_26014 [Trifolium repens]
MICDFFLVRWMQEELTKVLPVSAWSQFGQNLVKDQYLGRLSLLISIAAPFLTFESLCEFKSASVQDFLISKPLSRVLVVELKIALDMALDIHQTLIQAKPVFNLNCC